MKHASMTARSALLAALAAGLLSACGGGSDSGPVAVPNVTGTEVPVPATASAAEATSFVKTVAAQDRDQAEPIPVEGATLATSETAEPDPV